MQLVNGASMLRQTLKSEYPPSEEAVPKIRGGLMVAEISAKHVQHSGTF